MLPGFLIAAFHPILLCHVTIDYCNNCVAVLFLEPLVPQTLANPTHGY